MGSMVEALFFNLDFVQNLLSELVGIVVTLFGVNYVLRRVEARRNTDLRAKALQRASEILAKPLGHIHAVICRSEDVRPRSTRVLSEPPDDLDFFQSYEGPGLERLHDLSERQVRQFLETFVKCLENIEQLFAQFQTILTTQDLRMLLSLTDHLDTYVAKVRFARDESAAVSFRQLREVMQRGSEASLDAVINRIHRTRVYCSYRLVEESAEAVGFMEARRIWSSIDRERYRRFMQWTRQRARGRPRVPGHLQNSRTERSG